MLRTVDDWEAEAFAFRTGDGMALPAPEKAGGDGIVVPDAHLLFNADFSRAGHDLVLRGDDGASFVVHDYFATDARARLLSPEGASLSPEVVAALAGPLAPGQYAQAAPTPAAQQAVGRVATVDGNATIMRNGVAITPQTGDAVLKGDVLLTTTGSLGVTFNDGSTLNLTANSRLVVNEFVYDPQGSANSQILDLVQGSLTFISGEVAHSGNMKIGTPVATMGIRGTVGGVTTASDGTVSFYIVQSERGAVLMDQGGNVIANVVQNGPLIVVRPVGPLQVLAQEVQKTPDQLAIELAALQHIVNVKAVGDAIVRQFFQTNQPDQPHTQFQIDLQPKNDTGGPGGPGTGGDGINVPGTGNVTIPNNDDTSGPPRNDHPPIVVPIPPDLPPVNFAPQNGETNEDSPLIFGGGNNQGNRISVFDADTAVLRVTLAATHGTLTLSGVAGLIFIFGNGCADAMMTFTGPRAAIDAALNGLTFTPDPDYSGTATVSIVTSDGNSTTGPHTIEIDVNPVNDAADIPPVTVDLTEGDSAHDLCASGTLTIQDIDSPETFQAQHDTAGTYGTFSIDTDGNWQYHASSAHNEFVAGQVYTETFDVVSADGTVSSVTVNITGTGDAPVFESACYNMEAIENAPPGTVVGAVHADDPDNANLTYSILCGNDDGAFAIDGEGRIIVTGLLDADACASRELTIGVSDGCLTDETTVHIAIQDVCEPATATLTSTAGVEISATGEGATLGFVLQNGDNVTTPGTPEDRIVLGYDMGDSHIIRNAAPMMGDDDDFTTVATASYEKDGASHFTSILSDNNDVVLSQTISLGEDANYFTTWIDIFNGSGADIDNVRFMRNIDPDQDVDSFNTNNTFNDVLQNPGGPSPFAAVAATGVESGNQVVLLGEGDNWRASAFGFTNTDPYDSDAYADPQDPNGASGDIAIALTNDLGSIPDGGFARIEFITTANVATNGANALVGTSGCDTIDGYAGNDLLFGLGGADTFVFKPCYGADTIVDFSGHGGQHDQIDVADFEFSGFAELQAAFDDILLADGSHATVIDFGSGDTLTLKGVESNTLSADDFIFHHNGFV